MISRTTLTGLVALVATLLVAILPTATLARSPIAVGVSQYDGSRDPGAVDDFKRATGEYPASWTMWSTWGDPNTKAFPSGMVDALLDRGVVPMIWWEPMRVRESCDYARHSEIAAGKYDDYLKNFANAAKSFKARGHVLIRFAHEINGKYFPWSTYNCGNSVRSYKAAWRHIVKLFRAQGATNVKFVWTVSRAGCRPKPCNPYKPWYPGGKYVDYAGFSAFNWGAFPGKKWVSMLNSIAPSMKLMSAFTRKPVIVAELATNKDGGDKPAWIENGYPAVYNKFSRIKGINYLNVDLRNVGHPDWSLNTPRPEAMQAYSDVVRDPRFQGEY